MFKFKSDAPARTAELARRLVGVLRPGTVICLDGDLGAGKTLFVQNLAASLGVQGEVTSPTFNLMNLYEDGRLPLVHFDLYRLEQLCVAAIESACDGVKNASSSVAESDFNRIRIFAAEWSNVKFPLQPDIFLFKINYKLSWVQSPC